MRVALLVALAAVAAAPLSTVQAEWAFDMQEFEGAGFEVKFAHIHDGTDPAATADKDSDSIVLANKLGQRFRCSVPAFRPPEQRRKPQVNSSAIVEALTGTCVDANRGWWSYRLCVANGVAQFHVDKKRGETDVTSLGTFNASATKTANVDSLTYVEVFTNGTNCTPPDDPSTILHPRTTQVRYLCKETAKIPTIVSIEEKSLCRYHITVATAAACAPKVTKETAQAVFCVPIDAEGKPLVSAAKSPASNGPQTTEDNAAKFIVGERWSGEYVCQGQQKFSVKVMRTEKMPDGTEKVILLTEFVHEAGTGAFMSTAFYSRDTRRIRVRPGKWVRQPENFMTVTLEGNLSPDGTAIYGVVPECMLGPFTLNRVEGPEVQPMCDVMASELCSDACPVSRGPFSFECLEELWTKAGCSLQGKSAPRAAAAGQVDWWNAQGLDAVFQDMKWYSKFSDRSDYRRQCHGDSGKSKKKKVSPADVLETLFKNIEAGADGVVSADDLLKTALNSADDALNTGGGSSGKETEADDDDGYEEEDDDFDTDDKERENDPVKFLFEELKELIAESVAKQDAENIEIKVVTANGAKELGSLSELLSILEDPEGEAKRQLEARNSEGDDNDADSGREQQQNSKKKNALSDFERTVEDRMREMDEDEGRPVADKEAASKKLKKPLHMPKVAGASAAALFAKLQETLKQAEVEAQKVIDQARSDQAYIQELRQGYSFHQTEPDKERKEKDGA